MCVSIWTEVYNLASGNNYLFHLLEATNDHTTQSVTEPNSTLMHTHTHTNTNSYKPTHYAEHKCWQTLRCTCMHYANGWMLRWLVAWRRNNFYDKHKSKFKTTKPQSYSPHPCVPCVKSMDKTKWRMWSSECNNIGFSQADAKGLEIALRSTSCQD